MATTFVKTLSISQFKEETGATKINLHRSESGKPYATTDNGLDIKVSPAAELAAADAPETLRVSYCSDEEKDFFMLHVKRTDSSPVLFTL
jgi:hypothetical protein